MRQPSSERTPDRLNLGCGHDVRPGWINLDHIALPGVDVVHDLDRLPLPFADGSFDEVDCQDVLEHLDVVRTVRELHRILRPGGRLHIRSPHFSSYLFWADPTHRRAFSVYTFNFFAPNQEFHREYYFDFAFNTIVSARITFAVGSVTQPWNRIVEWVVNRSPRFQIYYEGTFLARLFPAVNVDVVLVR